MKIVEACIGVFIVMPIWFYLLYKILVAINATELMWFLFWLHLPLSMFISVLSKIIESDKL